MKDNNIDVSIIIPVYNVYDWIDQCMESILSQEYTNFEVILINDGSTDGSDEKCIYWKEKDKRIRYISKKNEGVSLTRNLGISEAKGEYLAFIDPDDWIDKLFIKELYIKALETDADFVECDIWRYNDLTGSKTYHSCYGCMEKDYTLEDHMIYGNTAIWKCLIRKTLFTNNEISFPDCHGQAKAVYALLLVLSNKVVNVHKALYYYRKNRKGSLSEKPKTTWEDEKAIGVQAYEYLINKFKQLRLYDRYSEVLERHIKYKLANYLITNLGRKDNEILKSVKREYDSFLLREFPNSDNPSYITFGGYNLNRIVWNLNWLHDAYGRFNFSSLIGIMHPCSEKIGIVHKNKYREFMVRREVYSEYWSVLREERPKYVFIDFIDERFDIIHYKEAYITKSDAFDESNIAEMGEMQILNRKSEECTILWEKSCLAFIERMHKEFPQVQVVLIENYLSEQVGDFEHREFYKDLKAIREMNTVLKHYYDYFAQNCTDVIVVETNNLDLYFTDKNYEYGAIPSHLNNFVNLKIANEITNALIVK